MTKTVDYDVETVSDCDNYVRLAVDAAGGPTKTSNALGVSGAAVHLWIAAKRVPNLDTAKKLVVLSGVALDKLRPLKTTSIK